MREGQPGGIEVVQPQRPLAAVRGRDLLQGLQELVPEPPVFGLCGRVLARLAFGAPLREDRLGRQRPQRIAPLQLPGAARAGSRALQPDLLEQRELAGLVVVSARGGFLVLVPGGVVALELLALEAAGQPVGRRDHPLQEGLGLVVGRRRVDQAVDRQGRVGLQRIAVDERTHVAPDQVGRRLLDQVECQARVGGMLVGVIAVAPAGIGPEGTVLGDMGFQHVLRYFQPRALGKLSQIMQIGGQGHPAAGCQQRRFMPGHQGCSSLRVLLSINIASGDRARAYRRGRLPPS